MKIFFSVFGVLVVVAATSVLVASLPDMIRYVRMKTM